MNAAERATLNYVESQIRQIDADARHLVGVVATKRQARDDPATMHDERAIYARQADEWSAALDETLLRLVEWRSVHYALVERFDEPNARPTSTDRAPIEP